MPVRSVVIDHLAIGVADIEKSGAFYTAALAPLGFSPLGSWSEEHPDIPFGPAGLDDFVISTAYEPGPGVHIAFSAETRAQVDAFHAAALAAGGRDNGAPGIRVDYHPTYYGAFVLDADGNNVEAVCHAPE